MTTTIGDQLMTTVRSSITRLASGELKTSSDIVAIGIWLNADDKIMYALFQNYKQVRLLKFSEVAQLPLVYRAFTGSIEAKISATIKRVQESEASKNVKVFLLMSNDPKKIRIVPLVDGQWKPGLSIEDILK